MNKGDTLLHGNNPGGRRMLWIGLACLGGLLLGACGGGDYDDGNNYTGGSGGGGTVIVEPLLSDIQAKIFTPTCATSGCHTGPTPAQGLDLSDGKTFTTAVNVTSTEDGTLKIIDSTQNADFSYLIRKLEGSSTWGIEGGQMPLGGGQLDQSSIIDVIRDWIDLGAQNN